MWSYWFPWVCPLGVPTLAQGGPIHQPGWDHLPLVMDHVLDSAESWPTLHCTEWKDTPPCRHLRREGVKQASRPSCLVVLKLSRTLEPPGDFQNILIPGPIPDQFNSGDEHQASGLSVSCSCHSGLQSLSASL